MKAALKLLTTSVKRKDGLPVVIDITDGKQRTRKTIGFSFIEDWNFDKQQPLKHHPKFYYFLPVVMDYHAKINKVNFGDYNFTDAYAVIFGVDHTVKESKNLRFYDFALQYCDKTTNGILYKTVLNSFEKRLPGVLVTDITKQMAKTYMNHLLKHQKPNGVHTYMRTLTALFTRISDEENPFKGVRPKKVKTENKSLTIEDIKKIAETQTYCSKFDSHNTYETINHFRYIWLLMFYLGGIDAIDLAKLRYDKHVFNNRIQFNRSKGGTSVFVNNIIVPQAAALLQKFDCKPYLVPIYKYKKHNDFVSNMNDRLTERLQDLQLTKPPLTKSARYSFITRAQQLLIDERITVEIVGHAQQKTHSIYTDEFPEKVRDEAHLKIVTF